MKEQHYIEVKKGTSYHEVHLCCSMIENQKVVAWFTDIDEAYHYAQQKAKELGIEYIKK